jgi:hypothetical protein
MIRDDADAGSFEDEDRQARAEIRSDGSVRCHAGV